MKFVSMTHISETRM